MQIAINIPDEQIKKSLKESKYIHEDEGVKGFVNIALLYTNGQLEFVNLERKKDFYSCKYKVLPKGHGRLKDENEIKRMIEKAKVNSEHSKTFAENIIRFAPTIIEADKTESEDKE